MEFNGTFELEDATAEEVWLALSDPVLVQSALPGCEFLVRVDSDDVDFDALSEEHSGEDHELTADPAIIEERAFEEECYYAALVQISVGPVNPTFETVVAIDRRDFPEMAASGEGSSGDSSFEMASSMSLSEDDDGVVVDWETQADVFGRVAQMGQRVANPVANRVVKRFFSSVQQELRALETAAENEVDDGRTDAGTDESEPGADAPARNTTDGSNASTDGEDASTDREDASTDGEDASTDRNDARDERAAGDGESSDDKRSLLDRLLGR